MSLHNFLKNGLDMKSTESGEKIEEEHLWLDILCQVQESSPKKLPSSKHLLILGDNESGKTSLIARLQANEDPKKGSALEYHYMFVSDEYRDDHTRLNIWVLDGDAWHRNLMKYSLNDETFEDSTVILTAAMNQPWDILNSIQSWAVILEEHIQRLKIPVEKMELYKEKINKRFEEYTEPGSEIERDVTMKNISTQHGNDSLSSAEIEINLGLDIIVVITKTDFMSTLEKDFDFKEEHFDFMQLEIRKFCCLYGASLFYVSVKEDKNCDLLLKYLYHRIYNFPFRTPALFIEKDAVFIPSGWDNGSKRRILIDNLSSIGPDEPYNEVIVKPMNRKPLLREAEVTAEDDQAFLFRLQSLINQTPASVGRPVSSQETAMRTPPGVQKSGSRISGSPVCGMQSSPKKIEGKPGSVGGEGVLQNFFNSLLNRRTTGSPIGGPLAVRNTGDKVASRHDAVAELDRMSGRNKKTGFPQSLEPSSNDDGSDDSSIKS